MPLESGFDTTFTAAQARREKQIQQTYRPIIGIHKWFARRPGTLFRSLLLAEFQDKPLREAFYVGHSFPDKTIADPFMGGGTPIIEANRVGMRVIGSDINPMSYWTVRQALAPLDLDLFRNEAASVAERVETSIGELYSTTCKQCGGRAEVKYFLWVKTYPCKECGEETDLFPGYLVATNDRHPNYVYLCAHCGQLAEVSEPPSRSHSVSCPHCSSPLEFEPVAKRGQYKCHACGAQNHYPDSNARPQHHLYALEYHCPHCKGEHKGRYFKVPDAEDLAHFVVAQERLSSSRQDLIPNDEIPEGDETSRLRRWGYRRYRDLFNERQLLGLQTLLAEIMTVQDTETRFALATVFSDMLRYQNMLGRYDTMALKCQDIFSVHGFPVGLVQCENNLLGIPGVGSGGFRHFVEKYVRAKEYCEAPFEISVGGRTRVFTEGERILAEFDHDDLGARGPWAQLWATDSSALDIEPNSLDGVFTDPPYFDNVQYAELIDFNYVWLRQVLRREVKEFAKPSTRDTNELTGNTTLARGIEHFTDGMSAVFRRMAQGLKPTAPLVFTYHHNDSEAYLPIIVAILDAGLACTATLSCPAEMSASLHINGTRSSTVDTIFVCRQNTIAAEEEQGDPSEVLAKDVEAIEAAGIRVSKGDLACMLLGNLARLAINQLATSWDPDVPTPEKLHRARQVLAGSFRRYSESDTEKQVVATC